MTFVLIRAIQQILWPRRFALAGSGSFGFWLRFRSVTGHCGHAPLLSLAKKPKNLAPTGYRISFIAPSNNRIHSLLQRYFGSWRKVSGFECQGFSRKRRRAVRIAARRKKIGTADVLPLTARPMDDRFRVARLPVAHPPAM